MTERSEEASYRVSVCLERFFSDERARCYVSVSAARPVRWLRRRLRRLFALPRRVSLLSHGHLLPPDEPLSLLRPDDVVQVIPTTVDLDKKDDSFNSEIDVSNICTSESPVDHTKWKCKRKSSCHQETKNDTDINSTEKITYSIIEVMEEAVSPQVPQILECNLHSGGLLTGTNGDTSKMIIMESPEKDPLDQMKEHALALLDSCAPPRRRRRVRRRRPRHQSVSEPCLNSEHYSKNTTELPVEIESDRNVKETEPFREEQLEPLNKESMSTVEELATGDLECTEESTKSYCVEKDMAPANLHLSSTGSSLLPSQAATATTPSLAWLAYSPPSVPSVVRNGAVTPRVPRVVRPLPV